MQTYILREEDRNTFAGLIEAAQVSASNCSDSSQSIPRLQHGNIFMMRTVEAKDHVQDTP